MCAADLIIKKRKGFYWISHRYLKSSSYPQTCFSLKVLILVIWTALQLILRKLSHPGYQFFLSLPTPDNQLITQGLLILPSNVPMCPFSMCPQFLFIISLDNLSSSVTCLLSFQSCLGISQDSGTENGICCIRSGEKVICLEGTKWFTELLEKLKKHVELWNGLEPHCGTWIPKELQPFYDQEAACQTEKPVLQPPVPELWPRCHQGMPVWSGSHDN